MPVTIRDVAKKLGLSITTVSRALDGYPDVSEATRQRVQQTASELGYLPNRAARQLRRKRTDTVGYVLPSSPSHFPGVYYSEFIAGLAEEAARNNYDLLVSSARAGGDTEQGIYQRWVCERRVDGFILDQVRHDDWRITYLSAEQIPFSSLERSTDPCDYPTVHMEYSSCVSSLVNHLVGLGFKRIALIGSTDQLTIHNDKFQGYRLGLTVNRLPIDETLITEADPTITGGYKAANKLLSFSKPPNAIICVNAESATGVIRAIQDAHLRLGEDLALIVFDGMQSGQQSQPILTSVDQPVAEIVHQLIKLVLAKIKASALVEHQVVIQPIVRFGLSTSKAGRK